MDCLIFKDDELERMIEIINELQLCFHPVYAPEGQFSVHNIFELSSFDRDIIIIADKNIVSPICEIARLGTLNDEYRLRKIALFVIWTKNLKARLTCGVGLFESDSENLDAISGEATRLQFLHGVDCIPAQLWKDLAFGYIDCVPNQFLYNSRSTEVKKYKFDQDFVVVSIEAAIIKIVQLLRTPKIAGIDKFITFMNWYTDNLDLAECVIVYAALVFGNIPHVAFPKGSQSKNYAKTVQGIRNQAWDITYIALWSIQYYNENSSRQYMFATDDITQKMILVNILPLGKCQDSLEAIFHTHSQRQKLEYLFDTKLGAARIRPFQNMNDVQRNQAVNRLVSTEYATLKEMF